MKPGQLVMLVRYHTPPAPNAPPIRSIGEFKSYFFYMGVQWHQCVFPCSPLTNDRPWSCHPTEVIALNDPDADVSDTTGMPIQEQLDVTYSL